METLEALQINLQVAFCGLSEEKLKDVCSKVNITLAPGSKGRLVFIQALNKYLETEELNETKLKELALYVGMKEKTTESKVKTESVENSEASGSKTEQQPVLSISKIKRDFKISGQIGDISQKDRLSFSSLAHQIEHGLRNDYKEDEIKEAVIKAINPALSLRSYLEGKSDLTLAKMRRILRSHYQERTATELYHQLSSTVQKATEKPQEFLIRLLDLKQKILFASQESESGLKYDPALVHGMLLHSFSIGLLSENIKSDMKPHLQKDTISDEELFEALNVCVSNETERLQKLGSRLTPKVNPVQESEAAADRVKEGGKVTSLDQALLKEVRELKAEIAAVKERVASPPRVSRQPFAQQPMRSPPQCRICQQNGVEGFCDHCFKCGMSGHYARECRARSRQWGTGLQGNGQRSRPGDRV